MVAQQTVLTQLDQRRKDLGMSRSALARRTGLGLRTIQRVLAGADDRASLRTVTKIAEALGVSIRLDGADLNAARLHQARRKARRLVALVQGSMALEAQAVESSTVREMTQRTVRDLLA